MSNDLESRFSKLEIGSAPRPVVNMPSVATVPTVPAFPTPDPVTFEGAPLVGTEGGALRDAYQHISDEGRHDRLVAPSDLKMENGRLLVNGSAYQVEPAAIGALFSQVATALPGFGRTATAAMEAGRIGAFDSLFNAALLGRPGSKNVRIGSRRLPGRSDRSIYRLVSETYGHTIDARAVLAAIGRAAARRYDLSRATVSYDGYRLTVDLLEKNSRAISLERVGDEIDTGVRLTTADDATEALRAFVYAWRLVCSNGMMAKVPTLTVPKIVHRGDGRRLVSRVNDAIGKAFNLSGRFLDAWDAATRDEVFSAVETGAMTPTDGFAALVAAGHFKVPGIKDAALVTALTQAWDKEPGYNRTSLVNAATRAAHEARFGVEARTALESQGTALLFNRIALSA